MSSMSYVWDLNDVFRRIEAGEELSSGTFEIAGGIFLIKIYKDTLIARPSIAVQAVSSPPNALQEYILKLLNSDAVVQFLVQSRHDFRRQVFIVHHLNEVFIHQGEYFPQGKMAVHFQVVQDAATNPARRDQLMEQGGSSNASTNQDLYRLATDLHNFCMSERFSDCSVVSSDDKKFPGHQLILASRSDVLAQQLQEFCPQREIRVPIDSSILPEVFHFLYGARISFNPQDYMKLFASANALAIPDLKGSLKRLLLRDITRDNLTEVIILAEKCKDAELEEACLSFLERNFDRAYISSDNWINFKRSHRDLGIEILEKLRLRSN